MKKLINNTNEWSDLQEDIVYWRRNQLHEKTGKKILGLQGPMGSGKSACGINCFLDEIFFDPQFSGKRTAFFAKSLAQMRGFVEEEVTKWIHAKDLTNVCKSVSPNSDWYIPNVGGKSVRVTPFLFGEQGAVQRAESIKGWNLAACYIDEGNNMSHLIRKRILDRMRGVNNWFIISTSNPGGKYDDYQENFLESESLSKIMDYRNLPIMANNSLPDDYEETLLATYTTVWERDRFIHGIPSDPDGLVWPDYTNFFVDIDAEIDSYFVGIDFASRSVTHAILIGYSGKNNTFYAIDEWRHHGEKDGRLSETQQAERIYNRFNKYNPQFYSVDKTSGGLRVALSEFPVAVLDSYMKREASYANLTGFLNKGKLKLSNHLGHLYKEIANHSYAVNKDGDFDSKPLAKDNHGIDALKYGMEWYRMFIHKRRGLMASGGGAQWQIPS